MVSCIMAVLCGVLLLAVDQYTKYLVASSFVLGSKGKTFIPKIIDLIYVKNNGGAWGMLGGYTWILLTITVIIMLVCIVLLFKKGVKSRLLFWAIVLVLSGGIGNLLDRVFRGGYVVDFLHFTFMPKFPVFNIADCTIVIGAGLLLLYFILDTVKESRQKKISGTTDNKENENG